MFLGIPPEQVLGTVSTWKSVNTCYESASLDAHEKMGGLTHCKDKLSSVSPRDGVELGKVPLLTDWF